MATENVVLVTFEEESKAYQAASALKDASAEGRIELHAVAVVQRAEDGSLRIKEGDADDFPMGTWTGGIIGGTTGGILGLTLGTLGGPLGLLLGGTGGMMLGSMIDIDDADRAESVLATMARAIEPNKTGLIADVTEPAVDVIDTEMVRLGGKVVRRPVVDVEAEIVAAEDAAMVAEEEARRKLREERSAERKEKVQQKIDELKAKVGGS
jgi:uncharacterized membrane protein